MSSRGWALLEVRSGLAEVMACPAVAAAAGQVHGPDGRAVPPAAAARMDSGSVELHGIDWFPDDEVVRDAAAAQWQAYLCEGTEQAGTWLAYTPGTGLVEGIHVGCEVVVPLDWTGPEGPGPLAAAHLARLHGVRSLLSDPPATPSTPPAPVRAAAPAATALAAAPAARRAAGRGMR